jgi:PIN domain nuclease of toxin-antitoxin system
MRLLIDTSVFLMLAAEPERLTPAVKEAVDTAAERFFSAASAWEIAIKVSIGKLRLPANAGDYVRTRMERFCMIELPVTVEHASRVESLDLLHRDPFDRLLMAQALAENLTILTTDSAFTGYGVRVFNG